MKCQMSEAGRSHKTLATCGHLSPFILFYVPVCFSRYVKSGRGEKSIKGHFCFGRLRVGSHAFVESMHCMNIFENQKYHTFGTTLRKTRFRLVKEQQI